MNFRRAVFGWAIKDFYTLQHRRNRKFVGGGVILYPEMARYFRKRFDEWMEGTPHADRP